MPGLFGAPLGISEAIADQQRQAMAQLYQGRAQMLPLEMSNMAAQTRLHTAQATSAEAQAREAQVAARVMSGIRAGAPAAGAAPTSLSGMLSDISQKLSAGGAPMMALKYAKESEIALGHETAASANRYRTMWYAGRNARQQLDTALTMLDASGGDPAQWEAVKRAAVGLAQSTAPLTGESTETPQQIQQFLSLPMTPENVAALRQGLLTTKERLDLNIKRENQRASQAYRNRRLGQIDTMNSIRERLAKISEEREGRLKGGKQQRVSAAEIKAAGDAIGKEFPQQQTIDQDAALAIADAARTMHERNPAISIDDARARVIQQYKAAGYFTGGKFSVAGTAKAPAALPQATSTDPTKALEEVRKQLKVGKSYILPSGIGVWNGADFDEVPDEFDEED